MEFTEVVMTRRSIHECADESLDDETLRTIFENAVQIPSSYNLQPWEFVVPREDRTQQLLCKVAYNQDHITGTATLAIISGSKDPETCAEIVTDDILGKGCLPSEETRDGILDNIASMTDLPGQERRIWTVHSTSLVMISFMYAAWDKGVVSCPVDGLSADAVLDTFDTDDERYEPVVFLTMGYPAEDADESQAECKYRRPIDEIVHFESFESGQSADPATADD